MLVENESMTGWLQLISHLKSLGFCDNFISAIEEECPSPRVMTALLAYAEERKLFELHLANTIVATKAKLDEGGVSSTTFKALNSQIDELNNRIKSLNDDLWKKQADVSELERKLAARDAVMIALFTYQVDTLEDRIKILSDDSSKKKAEMSDLSRHLVERSSELSQLQQEYSTLKESFGKSCAADKTFRDLLAAENAQLGQALADLSKAKEQANKELKAARNDIDSIKKAYVNQLAQRDRVISNLQSELNQRQAPSSDSSESVFNLVIECETLRSANERLQVQIDAAMSIAEQVQSQPQKPEIATRDAEVWCLLEDERLIVQVSEFDRKLKEYEQTIGRLKATIYRHEESERLKNVRRRLQEVLENEHSKYVVGNHDSKSKQSSSSASKKKKIEKKRSRHRHSSSTPSPRKQKQSDRRPMSSFNVVAGGSSSKKNARHDDRVPPLVIKTTKTSPSNNNKMDESTTTDEKNKVEKLVLKLPSPTQRVRADDVDAYDSRNEQIELEDGEVLEGDNNGRTQPRPPVQAAFPPFHLPPPNYFHHPHQPAQPVNSSFALPALLNIFHNRPPATNFLRR